MQFFRGSFNIIGKKIFITNFPFLTNSPESPIPHLLNSQNLLSMTNIFCQCLPIRTNGKPLETIGKFPIAIGKLKIGETLTTIGEEITNAMVGNDILAIY